MRFQYFRWKLLMKIRIQCQVYLSLIGKGRKAIAIPIERNRIREFYIFKKKNAYGLIIIYVANTVKCLKKFF